MPKGTSGIKRGSKSGKAQSTVNIPQAKTIVEANQLAVSLGLARHADFTGLDVSVANEMIAQIKASKDLIPDLPYLEIIGDTAFVRFHLSSSYISGDANASFMEVKGGSRNGQIGIGVNSRYFSQSNMQKQLQELIDDVASMWSPAGTGTVKGVIDHEIGHWIDHRYNISQDRGIRRLFRTYHEKGSDKKMGSALSRYANKNAKEFVAEAWREYRNNPTPRPVAKEVGDIIMSYVRGN